MISKRSNGQRIPAALGVAQLGLRRLERDAATASANLRDDAEGALVVAAVLHLQIGTGPIPGAGDRELGHARRCDEGSASGTLAGERIESNQTLGRRAQGRGHPVFFVSRL